MAVGFGSVWVAGGNDGTVIRIDPTLGQVQRTLTLANPLLLAPNSVFFVATDNRYVWVTRGDQLLRIDPRTDQTVGQVAIGAATSLATGAVSVWVTTVSERLVRVDAHSVEVTASSVLSTAAIAGAYGAGGRAGSPSVPGDVDHIDPISLAATTVGTTVAYPRSSPSGTAHCGSETRPRPRADRRRHRKDGGDSPGGQGSVAVTTDGDKLWAAVALYRLRRHLDPALHDLPVESSRDGSAQARAG